jgi:hypothetical protein
VVNGTKYYKNFDKSNFNQKCKSGSQCEYLKDGRCRYNHIDPNSATFEEEMMEYMKKVKECQSGLRCHEINTTCQYAHTTIYPVTRRRNRGVYTLDKRAILAKVIDCCEDEKCELPECWYHHTTTKNGNSPAFWALKRLQETQNVNDTLAQGIKKAFERATSEEQASSATTDAPIVLARIIVPKEEAKEETLIMEKP